jgi:hypothetical protein
MALSVSWISFCLATLFAQANAVELTSLVNLFIGTASGANGGSGGNVFPGSYLSRIVAFFLTCDAGAAIPHAMAKVCFRFRCCSHWLIA